MSTTKFRVLLALLLIVGIGIAGQFALSIGAPGPMGVCR